MGSCGKIVGWHQSTLNSYLNYTFNKNRFCSLHYSLVITTGNHSSGLLRVLSSLLLTELVWLPLFRADASNL